jgi:glycerophosphoryl diester phosphodiesterase
VEPPRTPIAFAHRGARAERRENTLAAFSRALELGASGLESDAWLTADGHVVLHHEGVTGPPWKRRAIAQRTRAELPDYIPSLADLYEACGTAYELSLDLKNRAAFEPILTVAQAADPGAADRLWLCDSSPAGLAAPRSEHPRPHLVLSTRLERIPEGFPARLDVLAGQGVSAVNLPAGDWTGPHVAATHSAGLLAFAWDAQTRATIRGLLDLGVDGIYSDHVDRLVSEIRNR